MKWPDLEAVTETIRLCDIPRGTTILGLAPIGIRWTATVTRGGRVKPEGNCPACEFYPCYVFLKNTWFAVAA